MFLSEWYMSFTFKYNRNNFFNHSSNRYFTFCKRWNGRYSVFTNSIIVSNTTGTALQATGTQLTVGNLIATTSATSIFVGNVAHGTTTPSPISLITIATSTTPQISLSSGLGTDTPWTLRSIGSAFFIASSSSSTYATSTNPALAIFSNGYVGIGTTTNALGPLAMNSGAFVTTGGVWTNASSRDLKENFTFIDPFEALEKIMQVPITRWNYKNEDASTTHIGPVAQDFFAAFQTGGPNGNVSISTIDPSGVALIGVQGLNMKLESLANASTTSPAAASFVEKFFARIIAWFADAANNIGDVFATAFHAKEKICVDDQCFTKDDIKSLLALIHQTQNNEPQQEPPSQPQGSTTPTDTTSPVITILGENPSQITVGTAYSDMGATVTDTDATVGTNNNLGLHFTVDGANLESVSIDTSTTTTHTIVYSAVDSSGNWGYATRTVKVISASN